MEQINTNYTNKNIYSDNSNAQSNRWFAIIDGLPGVELKLHRFTVPTMSIGTTETMHEGDNLVTFPGDTLYVNNLFLEFIVDVKFKNFFYAYKWMRENVRKPAPDVRDVTILMLDNQGNPQGVRFTYQDCFPISLSQFDLDSDGESHDLIASMEIQTNTVVMTIQDFDGTELAYPSEDYESYRG